MSASTFVRWTCNHCGGTVETSTRSKPERGICYEQGDYESSLGSQMLPDIWLCSDCSQEFADFCNLTLSPVACRI